MRIKKRTADLGFRVSDIHFLFYYTLPAPGSQDKETGYGKLFCRILKCVSQKEMSLAML